jgi:uncharacterized membrane protein YhaH (DUF805 family)
LQYFGRLVLYVAAILVIMSSVFFALIHDREPMPRPGFVFSIVTGVLFMSAIVFRVIALDIPRIRNIGWNPWALLFFLIPGGNLVMQILLLSIPPKLTEATPAEANKSL